MLTRRNFLVGTSLALAACHAARTTEALRPPPLDLLILGGTRFLGPALVHAAQARGHRLTLFNRGKSDPGLFADQPGLRTVHGDRDGGLGALAGLRFDAVLDTSGFFPRLVGAAAMALRESARHYVFISSISAYRDPSKPITEDAPLATLADPTVERIDEKTYGGLKVLCEQAAERAMPGRVTVVRPGFIVGPRDGSDRFTYWPARVARGGEMLVPGTPTDPIQVIDVRDLSAWLILLCERRVMGAFNAVGPPLPMGDVLRACEEVTGGHPRYRWVDAAFLEAQDADTPIWVPPTGAFAGFARTSGAKAVAAGLTFRPVRDTLRDLWAWWLTLPPARRAAPRAGLKPEREVELLAAYAARQPAK